jgi:endonuclease YncB( thermonuclease family)
MSLILFAIILSANIYQARVVRIVDGDTLRVEIMIWDEQTVNTSIRLRGVDTPEKRGKCPRERELALQAEAALAEILPVDSVITLSRVSRDKFGGRFDADVQSAAGRDPVADLITANLARPYAGAKRLSWCGE